MAKTVKTVKKETTKKSAKMEAVIGLDNEIALYLHPFNVYGIKPLETEELNYLFDIVKAGGPDADEAKNTIATSMAFALLDIAKRICRSNDKISDCIMEGFVAVYDAIRTFDPSRNPNFFNYACFIAEKKMKKYLGNDYLIVIRSSEAKSKLKKFVKIQEELRLQLDSEPTAEQIALAAGMNIQEAYHLQKIANMRYNNCSLNDDLNTEIRLVSDEPDFFDEVARNMFISDIKMALASYRNQRHAKAYLLHFGLYDTPMECAEIASLPEFNCSRQAIDKAIRNVNDYLLKRLENWKNDYDYRRAA